MRRLPAWCIGDLFGGLGVSVAIQRYERDRIFARMELPRMAGTSPAMMRKVLEYLAEKTHEDGFHARLRPIDEKTIAQAITSSTSRVKAALHGLESLQVVTLMRSPKARCAAIHWNELRKLVPPKEMGGGKTPR